MNYYALKALQARVYMWFGGNANIEKAAICAKEVIDDSFARLIDSETHNFDTDKRLYPEHIFNIEITDFNSILANFFDASDIGNDDALYFKPDVLNELYETGNENIGLVDTRFTKLFRDDILGKVSDKLRQGDYCIYRNIMPLIKLPEMYYILAECNTVKDAPDLAKAIEYLNQVRERRGIIQPIPETATKEEILDELTKEYRKEFICEGQLFYYYKRTGKTEIKLATGFREVDDQVYVLPFPDSEIEIGNREQ